MLHCLKCGSEIMNDLEAKAREIVGKDTVIVHVCGTCKSFFIQENGVLRKTTAKEMFDIAMENPEAMQYIDENDFNKNSGDVTVIVPLP